jgi:hypothetical protein
MAVRHDSLFPADRRGLIFPLSAKAVEGYRTPRRKAFSGAQWFPPGFGVRQSSLHLTRISLVSVERHHTLLQAGIGGLRPFGCRRCDQLWASVPAAPACERCRLARRLLRSYALIIVLRMGQ